MEKKVLTIPEKPKDKPFINVLIQYVKDKDPKRQDEYDFCVLNNLDHPCIKAVYNLSEKETDSDVSEEIRSHKKYNHYHLGKWWTYKDCFSFAKKYLKDQIVLICNLDIFLQHDFEQWSKLPSFFPIPDKTLLLPKESKEGKMDSSHHTHAPSTLVLCLSRYEYDPEKKKIKLDPQLAELGYANCQDAWIFRSPIEVKDCDFELGMAGCDQGISHRLRESGYIVYNPASLLQIIHYDWCRGKTSKTYIEVHEKEKSKRKMNKHPERIGQYLVPRSDYCDSLDKLADTLKLTPLQRYRIFCDIMSAYVKVYNRID